MEERGQGTTVSPVDIGGDDADRLPVEVVTTSGRATAVSLKLQSQTVEVWDHGHLCGVFDRAELRTWLATGHGLLTADAVTLSVDPRSDGERIAISLRDVMAWTISPAELAIVRARV